MPSLVSTQASHSIKIDQRVNEQGFYIMQGRCHFQKSKPLVHVHIGWEIVFVQAGLAEVFSRDFRFVLHPGHVLVIPAHQAHGTAGQFERIVVHFDPSVAYHNDSVLTTSSQTIHVMNAVLNERAANRFMWTSRQLLELQKSQADPLLINH